MAEDIFAILKKEHKQVMSIFEQIEDTEDGDKQQREKLLGQLKQNLLPHMMGEEETLYKMLKEEDEAREMVLEAIEEHHVGKLVMREMSDMSAGTEQWKAKAIVLRELIEHHVDEEEGELFDMAEELLSEEQLDEVVKQYQKAKQNALSKV